MEKSRISSTMDKFVNKVLNYIRENALIQKGDTVTLGFSGGADSVCLLSVLRELQKVQGFSLQAVHVNHQLRGAEADRDEAFCCELAKKMGVDFTSVKVDVRSYAAETGTTEEEAARILRYQALEECAEDCSKKGVGLIAVAHHADDQAETILLNLLRGSGLKGLGGMRAKRDRIIRPLLGVSRRDILDYLSRQGLSYVDDSTNFENEHTRNRLRNLILPELQELVNERALEHIGMTGAMVREADEYIAAEAAVYVKALGEPALDSEKGIGLKLGQQLLKEKAQIFRRYVIIETLRRLEVPLKDWGEKHFRDADRALFGNKGYHVDLPGGVFIENSYKETVIYKRL